MGIVDKGIPRQFLNGCRVGIFLVDGTCITGVFLSVIMDGKKSACQMTDKAPLKAYRRISPTGNLSIHFIGPTAAVPQPEVCLPFV